MGSFLELIYFLRIFAFKIYSMLEIERKFLVLNDDFINQASTKSTILQGYIFSNSEKSVRVRIKKDCDVSEAFLTIKGNGNESGTTRDEFEYPIPAFDAENMFDLCESMIMKTRYEVKFGNHTYEVDVFGGRNYGLTVAEIELGSEDEEFDKPDWLGEEVTGDERYYNSSLSVNQYQKWGGVKDKWVWFRRKRVELGDGHIIQYTLFESKRLFGIIIYHWKTIKQNRFHSHAFPAYAFLLNGSYDEEVIKDGKVVLNTVKNRFYPRFIPQNYIHRILKAEPRTWTIVFTGPWLDNWFEYFQDKKKWVKYAWGRKKVKVYDGDETLNVLNK